VAFASPKSRKVGLILVLSLLVLAVVAIAPPGHSFVGKITDSMCPQDDHSKLRRAPTDIGCINACVQMFGASYVLYDGKTTYLLSDQSTPEKFAGARVRVIGTLDAKTNTIQVDSITDKNIDSLAVAYFAVVTVFGLYLFSIASRTRHLEDEVARVAKMSKP
jgi:hypothetical protein